jgi:2-dehydro-3-deoxygalactonokinase
MVKTTLIAIDWGTTYARVYRLGRGGAVLGQRQAPLGIQQTIGSAYPEVLGTLLGDWADDDVPRIACGMIGSRQGWREVPYIHCPATLHALARGIVGVEEARFWIVPGLLVRDASGVPDVMRGEESQMIGAIDPNDDRLLCVMPGTHSKWARVEHGAIVDFATYMTGEMYSVLLAHSILGRLVEPGVDESSWDPTSFDLGLARGMAAGGFTHDVFGARTLALTGDLPPAQIPSWLSGFLIGREVRTARLWAFRAGYDASHVRVIGADSLVTRYLHAFGKAEVRAERGRSDAAARGLWRIAHEAGLVS